MRVRRRPLFLACLCLAAALGEIPAEARRKGKDEAREGDRRRRKKRKPAKPDRVVETSPFQPMAEPELQPEPPSSPPGPRASEDALVPSTPDPDWLLEAPAAAPEPSPLERSPAGPSGFELHGFAASRFLFVEEDPEAAMVGVLPTRPTSRATLELNLQPRHGRGSSSLVTAADLSLYGGTDETTLLLVNEAYVDARLVGPLRVSAGRRRVVWGSGLAANPTDLLNPEKSPLDPERQRTGAVLLPQLELATRSVTLTALASPGVDTSEHALPRSLDVRGALVAGRIYALVLGIDLNLVAYRDLDRKRGHYGGSLSRFVGDHVELHAESLVTDAPPDAPPLPWTPTCGPPPASSRSWFARWIAGGRYEWPDQTFVSLEYLHRGEGLGRAGYDQLVAQLPCLRQTLADLLPMPGPNPVGQPVDPPFLLLRRHYLVASFRRPHLGGGPWEDFSLGATVVVGAVDGSLLSELRAARRFGGTATVGAALVLWQGPRDAELSLMSQEAAGSLDLRVMF
jgi:hypothetical protein